MTTECISTDNPKHFPVYIERVAFGRAMFNYLERIPALNIKPIMVAGPLKDRSVKNETELKETIKMAHSDGLSTVMITCGSMIQGIGIEEFKDLVNLSTKSTYELFYQFFGRGWEIDVIKMANKKVQITMWDYDPHRIIKVGAQFIQSLAMTKGLSISAAFKLFFQIHNIWDYVLEGSSFRQPDEYSIQSEIREYVDSQVIKRGTRARLIGNVKPEVIDDFSKDFLELLLKTKGVVNKTKIKKLESYKNDLDKQKSNYSKKSHDIDIPKIPNDVKDIWESAVDGLNVYTIRIPIVTELMYGEGKIKTKNINELIKHYDDELFISGFRLPNSAISKEFSKWIDKRCDKAKINVKVDDEKDLIPEIRECLDLPLDKFLEVGDVFDEIYKYGGDDTQLTVRQAYYLFTRKRYEIKLQKIRAKVGQVFHVPYAKSGSINLAVAYILYNNSKKIFGREVTKDEIINSVTYQDEAYSNDVLVGRMGFIKSSTNKKDFIIINPPYKDGLHLKIFLESFNGGLNKNGTLICIHRETPVITKAKRPKYLKETLEYREIMLNNTSEITFLDGNKTFSSLNDAFFAPLILSRAVKDNKKSDLKINSNHLKVPYTYTATNFGDVYIHSDVDKTIRIREKLKDKMLTDSLYNLNEMSTKKIKNSPYFVNIIQLGGHSMNNGIINKDFYCLIRPTFENEYDRYITDDINKCLTPSGRGGAIRSNSYEESLNLFSYLKTKFVRFIFSLTKIDQNIWDGDMISIIPYLDFTKKWEDSDLFEYFDLEQDLVEYINEYIEPIYDYEKPN